MYTVLPAFYLASETSVCILCLMPWAYMNLRLFHSCLLKDLCYKQNQTSKNCYILIFKNFQEVVFSSLAGFSF